MKLIVFPDVFHIGFPKRFNRSNVLPVAVEIVSVNAVPSFKVSWNHVLTKVRHINVIFFSIDEDFTAPESLQPEAEIVALAQQYNNGATITITDDLDAVKGVDMLYTDVWVSMGEAVDFKERIDLLLPYQINADLLAKTENPNVIVMHCLPAFHDLNTEIGQEIYQKYGLAELEITDAVFQQFSPIIFQEAENRMHSIKAIMYQSLKVIS